MHKLPKQRGRACISFTTAILAVLLAPPAPAASVPAQAAPASGEVIALSIDEAVALAFANSYRVARAVRNEQIAELRARGASAHRLPRFSVGVGLNQAARGTYQATPTYTREQGLAGDFRTGVNIAAQMPIDLSGSLRRQIEQAEGGHKIAELDVEQVRVDTAFEVRAAYISALRAREAARLDDLVVLAIMRLVKVADAGTAPFLAVEGSAARQALETSRAAAETSEEALRQLLRLSPSAKLVLATAFEAVAPPGVALETTIDYRPDVRQARLRIEQARLAVKQSTDGRKPSMTLNAYFNQAWTGKSALRAGEGTSRDQGGVVALSVPLYTFDWGQSSSAKQIARIGEEQARSDLEERRERADFEVRQAVAALQRAEARSRGLPREEQAMAALMQAERAFLSADIEERGSLLAQVSNARAAWREARLSALSVQTDRALAAMRIERALGKDSNAASAISRGPYAAPASRIAVSGAS